MNQNTHFCFLGDNRVNITPNRTFTQSVSQNIIFIYWPMHCRCLTAVVMILLSGTRPPALASTWLTSWVGCTCRSRTDAIPPHARDQTLRAACRTRWTTCSTRLRWSACRCSGSSLLSKEKNRVFGTCSFWNIQYLINWFEIKRKLVSLIYTWEGRPRIESYHNFL